MKNLRMSKISTKNILKKIFKSKPEKKVKKKITATKVVKIKKVTKDKAKKVKKVVAKKTKKVSKKISPKPVKAKKVIKATEAKEETKVDNLRISKSNEVKPEIKKVKKQETEKREYKIKKKAEFSRSDDVTIRILSRKRNYQQQSGIFFFLNFNKKLSIMLNLFYPPE